MLLSQYLITSISILVTPVTVIGIGVLVEFFCSPARNSQTTKTEA